MEILPSSNKFNAAAGLKRRSRRFMRFDASILHRKNMNAVRLGGIQPRGGWRIRAVPKLKFKMVLSSPVRLWRKIKNGYVEMMLNLVGNQKNNCNVFGGRRVPKGRHVSAAYSRAEFDNRLVFEIYKSLLVSREMASTRVTDA